MVGVFVNDECVYHRQLIEIRDARGQAKELGDRAARLGKGDALAKRAAALSPDELRRLGDLGYSHR